MLNNERIPMRQIFLKLLQNCNEANKKNSSEGLNPMKGHLGNIYLKCVYCFGTTYVHTKTCRELNSRHPFALHLQLPAAFTTDGLLWIGSQLTHYNGVTH